MVSHSAKVALAVSAGFAAAAAAAGAAYLARAALFRRRLRRAREEWALAGRDVVVLHQFPRPGRSSSAAVALSLSPFPAKLETWLRVVGAKYVNDYTHPTSPETGKSPWVTFNGEEISDSQVIIETLSKKIGMMRELSLHLSPKEKAVSRSLRVMLEEHFYWVLVIDRYVSQEARYLQGLARGPDGRAMMPKGLLGEHTRRGMVAMMTRKAHEQGLLRLGIGRVQKCGIEDLEALSTFLGSKSYVMGGDKPTELDCTLFGFVQCLLLTTQPDCLYKTLVEKRLTNLQQHFNRMRAKFYPDWSDIMEGKKSTAAMTKPPEEENSSARGGK